MKNKIVYHIIRVLVGLLFAATGLAKFFPSEAKMTPAADALMAAFASSGYFIPFLGICEIVVGLMLLFNFWPALASVMLVPLTLNIVVFLIALAPSAQSIIMSIVFAALNAYLICYFKDKYMPMLTK